MKRRPYRAGNRNVPRGFLPILKRSLFFFGLTRQRDFSKKTRGRLAGKIPHTCTGDGARVHHMCHDRPIYHGDNITHE